MNGNNGWFGQLTYKMKMGLQRFMAGRYGTDKLNNLILILGLVFCVGSMFLPAGLPVLVMTALA